MYCLGPIFTNPPQSYYKKMIYARDRCKKERENKNKRARGFLLELSKVAATIRYSMGEQPTPWNLLQPQDAPSVSNTNPKTITL